VRPWGGLEAFVRAEFARRHEEVDRLPARRARRTTPLPVGGGARAGDPSVGAPSRRGQAMTVCETPDLAGPRELRNRSGYGVVGHFHQADLRLDRR
jgi:hypothetical protein